MRKLTVEERQNLTDNRDIIGEIALELSQMDRNTMKIALNRLISLRVEFELENGEVYNEDDIKF